MEGLLLSAEVALAHAQADVGEIPPEAAAAIDDACRIEQFDVAAIVEEAAVGGNPVIPMVSRLRDLVDDGVSDLVHRGATSQDILDAAALTIVHRCGGIVGERLRGRDIHRQARVDTRRRTDDRSHAWPARCRPRSAQ